VPQSLQRVLATSVKYDGVWIGPKEAASLSTEDQHAYDLAFTIMRHLAVRAPREHKSGHPGGPLSAFTFAYLVSKRRDPSVDQPLRISAGHLSVLSYGLQWLLGHSGKDERLATPQSIIENFRIPSGLPGHIEAGIGDIPFGTGPLGKGVSHALGAAFGLKHQKKPGTVDVLLADGDAQEGQVMEAFRLASHLKLDNLVVHGDFNDVQLSDLPSRTVAADFASIAHACGWRVIEVQNGNDPAQVEAALQYADSQLGKGAPIFLCYYTTMGHGISFMEHGSNTGKKNYHGSPLSDDEAQKALDELPDFEKAIAEYEPIRKTEEKRFTKSAATKTDILLVWKSQGARTITKEKGGARKDFGAVHLKNLMSADSRIVVLHADLAGSGGFDKVAKQFPDRVINVGVAEANMAMMAAGMRQTGLLPVTYTFAAFGTNEARANARLIDVNCGHTRCGVIHDCTHAGLSVGEDGETHQEQNYLNIPFHHTQVWMPADCNQVGAMAERAMELICEGHTNVFVFSARSDHPQLTTPGGDVLYGAEYIFDGKMDLVRGAGDFTDQVTIIATGIGVHDAVAAADALSQLKTPVNVRVLNASCIRPLDASAVVLAAFETHHIVVVEDHNSEGGLASQVADVIADFELPCSLRRLGLSHYFPSGSAEDLKFMAGLDSESITDAALDAVHTEVRGGEDALVSAIAELVHNAQRSRFREHVAGAIRKLLTEKGYLERLRKHWQDRASAPDQLPGNEQLLEMLKELA
jgi:transketolase